MPPDGVKPITHDAILRYEEISVVAKAAAELGINKLRLTGGEPLVRKDRRRTFSRLSQIYGYFRELAKTSRRVLVEVIGKTEEGREILLAAIADENGIHSLSQLKEATAALAGSR
jgi:cyclic pyranopterin phosphate synthase